MGSPSHNTSSTSDEELPAALWNVAHLVSRELQARKDELKEANDKLASLQAIEEVNMVLRDEVKCLRKELETLRAKGAVDKCASGICPAATEAIRLNQELAELRTLVGVTALPSSKENGSTSSTSLRWRDMTNETIIKNKPSPASNVTAPSSFSIIRKTIGNQTTPACDPSVTTTVFRASGYRNSTAPPNQPSNERDIGQMVVQSPDSMQLFTSGTMRTSPPILTKRTASMPNIPPSSHAATPQSNMRPKHLSLLSSSGISGMDMMLMMRASLRVECDAYPALFCRENILWSFDNSPQNTILLLPKTFYEPYEGEEKQWSSNTAFTSPTGQTWEILFQEDPNAVYYAGTYECQLSPTTVPLTYSQLNEPVRAALCRDTLHPSWRCRLPGGEARQTMISTIDNAYRAGRIEIAGLRLNHVGFNQKLLQRLLVEIAGSESGTGIVKINSQPSSVAPSSKGDRSRRRSGGQNQDVMERAAKRPRGSIPT